MTRNRLLFFLLSIAVVTPVVTGTFLAAAGGEGESDSLYKFLTVFTEVLHRVEQNYVEPVDMEALIDGALDGAADALDPFSVYVPAQVVEPYLAVRAVGTRHSGLLLLKEQGVLFAAGVQPASPAAEAGVQLGDIIAEIDGEPTRTMPLWRAQEILAGEPSRRVTIGVIRLGERHDVVLELRRFEAAAASLSEHRGVPVLRIPGFEAPTAGRVEELLAELLRQGRERLLVDLRGVAGGDPGAAYAVAGLFASGELGQLVKRDSSLATYAGRPEPLWQGRVAVLTDRGTLGPAELVATILRQKKGAELVGERTFGYAGRQGLAELSTGGRLVYTDAFYTGPDGEPLRQSLRPDLRVDARFRDLEAEGAAGGDAILDRGVGLLLGEEEVDAREAA